MSRKKYVAIDTDVVKELLKGLGREGKGVDNLLSVRYSYHKGEHYIGFIYDNPAPGGTKGKKTLLVELDDAKKLAKEPLPDGARVAGIASLYGWNVPKELRSVLPEDMNAGHVCAGDLRGTLLVRGLRPDGDIHNFVFGSAEEPLDNSIVEQIMDAFARKVWIGFMLGYVIDDDEE